MSAVQKDEGSEDVKKESSQLERGGETLTPLEVGETNLFETKDYRTLLRKIGEHESHVLVFDLIRSAF